MNEEMEEAFDAVAAALEGRTFRTGMEVLSLMSVGIISDGESRKAAQANLEFFIQSLRQNFNSHFEFYSSGEGSSKTGPHVN